MINTDSRAAISPQAGHSLSVLTEIYIEALLVDEEAADRDWEAWNAGEINSYWAT